MLVAAASAAIAAQRDYFFETVTAPGDLAQQTVTDIAQDDRGFLWVGTQGGLHRLDSAGVRLFQRRGDQTTGLPDSFITALEPAMPGGLWVGTRSGHVLRLVLADERFEIAASIGPGGAVVDLLHRPGTGLWVAAANTLVWLPENGPAQPVVAPEDGLAPRALAALADGRTFLVTTEALFEIDAGQGARERWRQPGLSSILAAGDSLLIGADDGVWQFDPASGGAQRVWSSPPGSAQSATVRRMARDPAGHLWLAVGNRGLVRLDTAFQTEAWLNEVPGLPGALPEDSIRALRVDRAGLLWLGGQMRGVAVTDPAGARFSLVYDDSPGASLVRSNSIRAILDEGPALWLGTDGDGLKRYDPVHDRFERFDRALAPALGDVERAAALQVHGLVLDAGWLWISGDAGLLRLRLSDRFAEAVGGPGSPLRTPLRQMLRGRDGTLWIGSNASGLLEVPAGSAAARQYLPQPGDPESLSDAMVHTVLEDRRDRLWVGTDNGLNRLDRVTGKFQRFGLHPDDAEGLPDSRIRALHESDDGTLWIGGHAGLSRLVERDDGSVGFQWFGALGEHGAALPIVFGILPDRRGMLWLSTSHGVIEFDPSSGHARRYGLEHGLQDLEFNGGAAAVLRDGRLAFGGVRGLNLIRPDVALPAPAATPVPALLWVQTGYDETNLVGLTDPESISIPPRSPMLRVGLGSPDIGLRRELRYRYRIDGLDQDWIEAGPNATVTYTRLPPGRYEFQAQARRVDGNWPDEGLRLPVTVQASWWNTTSAYVLFALLGLAVLGAGAMGIVRRRRQESALLGEIAQREERLKLALWGSGDEFWDWDIRYNRLYRLGTDHLLGEPDSDDPAGSDMWRSEAIHPDDLPRVQEILQQHILGKIEYFESEHRVRNAQGEWIWVLSRGKVVERDENGDPLRMAGTARDITQSRRAERERRIALEVLAAMSEAVAVTDVDFNFISVNQAFSRITGYAESEVVGRSSELLDSSQHSAEFYRRLRQTVRDTGHWAGEMWQRRKDGEEFLGWIEIAEVKDASGQRSHYVAVVNDITDKKRAEQELRYLANYDTLTGLPNRALLSERLSRAIVKARRQDTRIAVLFLDLDRFKDINDSLGHSAGDRILKASAARLLAIVGPGDTVARLGGDEFTVVLEDVESLESVEESARRVLGAFADPLEVDDRNDVTITPSIGISLYPDHGLVPTDLLKFADTAMYQAKSLGRNTFQIYTEEMDAEARQRATMVAALRRAVDRGELRLLYQPRLSLSDGKITGVEALLRWHSQELGEVQPTEFIPLAEESGLILQIGEWVLREACITLRRWRRQGLNDIAMAVNVSVLQLLRGALPELIARTLSEIDIPANRLELEVTESMVMANAAQTTATLQALRALGLSIAIDDFGTGYSSLVYLKRLPIDTLKIDKEFVGDLTTDPDDEAITATVITMAHSLGLNVIAEGVETQQQLEYLREQRCDEIQGYWLSPPLDSHHCLAFMRTWQPTGSVLDIDEAIDQY